MSSCLCSNPSSVLLEMFLLETGENIGENIEKVLAFIGKILHY